MKETWFQIAVISSTSRTNPANKLPGSALSPAPWRVLKRGIIHDEHHQYLEDDYPRTWIRG